MSGNAIDRWCQNNVMAAHLCLTVCQVFQDWQHISTDDGSKVDTLLSWLAFGKEEHPFFSQNADKLRPVLLASALSMRSAPSHSKHDTKHVVVALQPFFHVVSWLCGGEPGWRSNADEIQSVTQLEEITGRPAQTPQCIH